MEQPWLSPPAISRARVDCSVRREVRPFEGLVSFKDPDDRVTDTADAK